MKILPLRCLYGFKPYRQMDITKGLKTPYNKKSIFNPYTLLKCQR